MHMTVIHPEIGLGAEWTKDYIEQRIDDTSNVSATSSGLEQFQVPEVFKREYFESQPEVLEFMKQYDINHQTRQLACLRDDSSVLNEVEEELEAAGTWTDEFIKDNVSSGLYP